jgi:hypothetical protein
MRPRQEQGKVEWPAARGGAVGHSTHLPVQVEYAPALVLPNSAEIAMMPAPGDVAQLLYEWHS